MKLCVRACVQSERSKSKHKFVVHFAWFSCGVWCCVVFIYLIFVLLCFCSFLTRSNNSNSRRESSNNSITISNKNKKNREKTTKHSYIHEVCVYTISLIKVACNEHLLRTSLIRCEMTKKLKRYSQQTDKI